MSTVLAFDFGASSGRLIKGEYNSGVLTYHEVHRFDNTPREQDGVLCWDFDELMAEVRCGIEKAGSFDSVAFDTWGVDFGLLGSDGKLMRPPVHYRDRRTIGMVEATAEDIPAERLYACTGNQIMPINTLFQLLSIQQSEPELLEQAQRLLFMPDLFAYHLCGQAVCERTIASTSQMLSPLIGEWSDDVLTTFGLRKELFAPLVQSGTVIGEFNGAKVIAAAGHDTQCAIAAMPSDAQDAAFLSCGTWSLFGVELDEPVLSDSSMNAALSNELGANGRVNYLKNIIGLWLIQESRRSWRKKGSLYSYGELEYMALEESAFKCFIDPDAPEFAQPGDIPERVREFCRRTGQNVPGNVGAIIRCIYQSLALKYRYALDQLRSLCGKPINQLHMLGGGVKDALLCQMTANSCAIPVIAGPIEATALGNIIIQLVALGELPDIAAGRRLIADTEPVKCYMPQDSEQWDAAYETYKRTVL